MPRLYELGPRWSGRWLLFFCVHYGEGFRKKQYRSRRRSRAKSLSSMDHIDEVLTSLLKSPSADLSQDEIQQLLRAFSPARPASSRSAAYLVLSAYCQKVKDGKQGLAKLSSNKISDALASTFATAVLSILQELHEEELSAGLTFMVALFQVEAASAAAVFLHDGFIRSITEMLETNTEHSVSLHIAHLLAQASGQKACRSAIPSEWMAWLTDQSKQTADTSLRVAAAVALVKLSQGSAIDTSIVSSSSMTSLAKLMKDVVLREDGQDAIADAVEGLAYTTRNAEVKEMLSRDSAFLHRLFSLVPQSKLKASALKETSFPLIYGVILVILNIVAYQPRLSDEQTQIAKLKRMANAGTGSTGKLDDPGRDKLDDDEHVRLRGRRMVACGVANVLSAAARSTESRGVKVCTGKAFRHLIEDKENRGKVLQSGCGKALMVIIRSIAPESTSASLEPDDLEAIQALAKLAITSSPLQVFGPDAGATHDAIRPFSTLLAHQSSTLLQRFESMMALTNVTSLGPEASSRVASSPGLLNKVEMLLLDENVMIRRAAVELLCNLAAGSDSVFERYANGPTAKSKLRILVALADVEDLPTRLASSGTLATLTMSPHACTALCELEFETQRVLPVLKALIIPPSVDGEDEAELAQGHPGLVHRGVVCIRNILGGVQSGDLRKRIAGRAEDTETVKALVGVVRGGMDGGNQAVLVSVAEALKYLMDAGINVKV